MSERLKKGTIDALADSIWLLGKMGIERHMTLMPPAMVRGVMELDGLCIEPFFFIARPMPDALHVRPLSLGLSISEVEPFRGDVEYTLYDFKSLELDMARRRHTFSTGIQLQHADGSLIEPATTMYVPGKASHFTATSDWTANIEKLRPRFTMDEAEYFLETIDRGLQSAQRE
jgi:hypothetical protein